MTNHHIKIDTQYVDAVLTGLKPFEVRRNDRAYQVGDHLIMTEVGDAGDQRHWIDTEDRRDCGLCRVRRYIAARIAYVYSGDPRFGGHGGLQPGYVVLGLNGIDVSLPVSRATKAAS